MGRRSWGREGLVTREWARWVFFTRLVEGWSQAAACREVGIDVMTGVAWTRQPWPGEIVAGMKESVVAGRGRLSFVDRARIEQLRRARVSPAEIARLLGRCRSTISRELKRGQDRHGRYWARVGQDQVEGSLVRPKARKLESDPVLRAQVVQWLAAGCCPAQVSGPLVFEFPHDQEMRVSHETIYQALYVLPRGGLAAEVKSAIRHGKVLRTGREHRNPQGRTHRRGKISEAVSISERPAEADDRAVPGHWEGDLILGSTASGSAIGTLVERTTGFVMMLHLPENHKAATVAAAIQEAVPKIPQMMRRSLTWDQGKEMAHHAAITAATDLPIYFANPHSPWQRGSNENINGLLRDYFPKSTDLSVYDPTHLELVAQQLNNRPRKRHQFATPAEVWNKLLLEHEQMLH